MVPGVAGLQRMAMLLIAERSPGDARVLVLGAGGGLEIKSFDEVHSGWTFDGVDPSAAMLGLAKINVQLFASRTRLHHGLIDVALHGPFDAATCLLTLLPASRRKPVLRRFHLPWLGCLRLNLTVKRLSSPTLNS